MAHHVLFQIKEQLEAILEMPVAQKPKMILEQISILKSASAADIKALIDRLFATSAHSRHLTEGQEALK